ncbi:MAG TPA: PhzF family phenazine biosynthesis protein [Solirubrobacteraceae bacterium]|jgi:trans-2,3-dihydro-3-hydroxyanthranilate isomerase
MAATVIPGSVDWLERAELHEYLVVDAFTPHPLEGNQLGVFLDGRPFTDDQMLALAREMKFAETVFLLPAESSADVRVRIFTPGGELPFAGHPVLGTAFVVGTALGSDSVVLQTGAGDVPVVLDRRAGQLVFGRMEQPIPTPEPYAQEAELLAALGVESSLLPVELYRQGPEHVYVTLASEEVVAALRPDMAALSDLAVAANCFAGHGTSWTTRMFCPAFGVPEDAATGSAAGPLALHLARHGRIAFGQEIEIHQGEAIDRPSLLYAKVTGSPERIESIQVAGGAQIVAHGHFRIGGG